MLSNIKLVVVAAVCLVVGLSAPAISDGVRHARFAHNADKVDKINSTRLQFPLEVPENVLTVGSWGLDVDTTSGGDWGARINYPAPMPAPLTFHYVPSGTVPPPACPGNSVDPKADPGHVCVYETTLHGEDATIDPYAFGNTRFGFNLLVNDDVNPGDLYGYGTWAARPGGNPAPAPQRAETEKE